jgi:hypothetical protein
MRKNNIIHNLKLGVSFVLIAFSFSSCLDLNEDPAKSRLAPGKYSNQAEFELGVTGLYRMIANAASMTTFQVVGWAGDDITTHRASNKADFREYDQRSVSPLNARSATNWRAIYAVVRAANSVLDNADGLVLTNKATQDALTGETYFIRALMFHQLQRTHGQIPLHLSVIPNPTQNKSSVLEVYKQIESDLLKAENLLPVIYPGVNAGAPRPNKGSARSFLARLYLDWAGFPVKDQAKYALAATSAKTVIDNSASHGFSLVPDLENLWTLAGRFSKESIFTLVYSLENGLNNRKYGKLGHPSDLGGWQETFAEIKYFEDFPDQPRKAATYRLDYAWQDFTDQANPVFKKVVGPINDISRDAFNTNRNDFVMRYAEVLLIYAEASGRSGNETPAAWEALNQIKRRAEGLPFVTPSAKDYPSTGNIADLAYTERKWELAGEYLRWNDLVRMEKVAEAMTNRTKVTSKNSAGVVLKESNDIVGSTGTDNYFAPIPQNEVALNPNLK